jgi:hypothetical protein
MIAIRGDRSSLWPGQSEPQYLDFDFNGLDVVIDPRPVRHLLQNVGGKNENLSRNSLLVTGKEKQARETIQNRVIRYRLVVCNF